MMETDIVFFDVETTVPHAGKNFFDIIEFGGIIIDGQSFYEKETYSTLIWSDHITDKSFGMNGITVEMVKDQPKFKDVADRIFQMLDNRIWAGQNIKSFDIHKLENSFEEVKKNMPKSAGVLDLLPLMKKHLKGKIPNFQIATAAEFFNLGKERHRALEDAKMELEIFKNLSMYQLLKMERITG